MYVQVQIPTVVYYQAKVIWTLADIHPSLSLSLLQADWEYGHFLSMFGVFPGVFSQHPRPSCQGSMERNQAGGKSKIQRCFRINKMSFPPKVTAMMVTADHSWISCQFTLTPINIYFGCYLWCVLMPIYAKQFYIPTSSLFTSKVPINKL